jgi:sulfide:quinone oxidoreductase
MNTVPIDRTENARYRFVIVGGGSGGLAVAARLARHVPRSEIAIIEPSPYHYYQPLWTLVGAGVVPKEQTRRDERDYIPHGTRWIQDRVSELLPGENRVRLEGGGHVAYEYLVLAPGITLDWDHIDGLRAALGKDGVCSIYDYEQAETTWQMIRSFRGGTAIFTMPATPIKCGGAPQKIMYLAEETFREAGIRGNTRVIGAFAGAAIFGIPAFKNALERVIERKQIDFRPKHELIAVDAGARQARFRVTNETGTSELELKYDLLHVVPPQSAPAFVKQSPLATTDGPVPGWAKVDKYTLRSPDFGNVFALGDASSLPTSRTGAAIRKQAPVLVENLLSVMNGREPLARYDGYASCPLLTSRKTVMLAEFDYEGKPVPTFPLDPTKERRSMYWLKRYGLPLLYWNGMLRGRV